MRKDGWNWIIEKIVKSLIWETLIRMALHAIKEHFIFKTVITDFG